jgi:hypothetical protein
MKRLIGFAVLMVLASVPAFAVPILDFGVIAPTAGTFSYAGGAAPLIGTAQVDNVTGLGGTPLNDGVARNIIGGLLTFTSGANVGNDAGSYNWGAGGSIVLTGCVDLNNNGVCNAGDASGVLFSGYFLDTHVIITGGNFKVFISDFTDQKNDTLTAFYGLPTGGSWWTGNTNISFSAPGTSGRPFSSTSLLSGDMTNFVPEPSTVMLLGTALLGIGFASRRKLS